MTGAAFIDGFLSPEIGLGYLSGPQPMAEAGLALVRFCSIVIQLFTKSGVIAISIAILLWSIGFVRSGRGPFLAAIISVIAALSQTFILAGASTITAHTIVFIVAAQMLWYFIVGLLMASGRL